MSKINFIAARASIALALSALHAASAQTLCPVSTGACGFSVAAGSVATIVPGSASIGGPQFFQRIYNSPASDLWCTRDSATTPAVNGVGSFRIAAGDTEEFPTAATDYIPPGPTRCTAASGTATGEVESR